MGSAFITHMNKPQSTCGWVFLSKTLHRVVTNQENQSLEILYHNAGSPAEDPAGTRTIQVLEVIQEETTFDRS